MQFIASGAAPVHSANLPNSPEVTVLFGCNDDSDEVGMVRVSVPPGAGMPPHRHHGSDVILTPVTGGVRVSKDETTFDVGVGDTLFIDKDEAVALTNPHDETADLIVAAGPAAFVSTVRRWPQVSTSTVSS